MAVAWGMSLVCAKYRDRPQQHLCHYTCATTTATSTLLPSLQYGLAALLIVQLVPGSFQWNRWMIWVLVFYTELVFSTRHYHCIVCNLFIFSSAGFERPLFLSFFFDLFFSIWYGQGSYLLCWSLCWWGISTQGHLVMVSPRYLAFDSLCIWWTCMVQACFSHWQVLCSQTFWDGNTFIFPFLFRGKKTAFVSSSCQIIFDCFFYIFLLHFFLFC